jgi:hypothetical protein
MLTFGNFVQQYKRNLKENIEKMGNLSCKESKISTEWKKTFRRTSRTKGSVL